MLSYVLSYGDISRNNIDIVLHTQYGVRYTLYNVRRMETRSILDKVSTFD